MVRLSLLWPVETLISWFSNSFDLTLAAFRGVHLVHLLAPDGINLVTQELWLTYKRIFTYKMFLSLKVTPSLWIKILIWLSFDFKGYRSGSLFKVCPLWKSAVWDLVSLTGDFCCLSWSSSSKMIRYLWYKIGMVSFHLASQYTFKQLSPFISRETKIYKIMICKICLWNLVIFSHLPDLWYNIFHSVICCV